MRHDGTAAHWPFSVVGEKWGLSSANPVRVQLDFIEADTGGSRASAEGRERERIMGSGRELCPHIGVQGQSPYSQGVRGEAERI